MAKSVYLDNGATTSVRAEVAALCAHAMTSAFGNPSSPHRLGAEAARLVTEARERIARALGSDAQSFVFTSGGTESNALAIESATFAPRCKHVVVSAFEHPSVLEPVARLAERGIEVTYVRPERDGRLSPERFVEAVRPDTGLVAAMWVQNELGTIQPVEAIARAVHKKAPRCHVHVDAVQAAGKIAITLHDSPFDSLSISAHKLHGPKGAGALWLKNLTRTRPILVGGGQERGLRAGTENVPAIAGFGLAVELAEKERSEAASRMTSLRDRLWTSVAKLRADAVRLGAAEWSAPHILTVGIPLVPSEPLLHALEQRGVFVSSGSACHALKGRASESLAAIDAPLHLGVVRFSLSSLTTEEEIDLATLALSASLAELTHA